MLPPTILKPDGLSCWAITTCCFLAFISELGQVDIFIHDSNHTYADMKFEFEASYPHIRSAGLLLSDDTSFNTAFSECANLSSPGRCRIIRNLGIMKKA